jgi:regulator of sigma E protease
MTTLLAFAVTLGILIVIHEFGHYAVARACGVKVLRFSVGFGPVIARRLGRSGTEWALSAIPLGGYVKMLDERETEVAAEDLPHAFNRKSVGQRMAIVVAGPLANLLLAVFLYWLLYVQGVSVLKPVLDAPPAGSPAAVAGFQRGETVTAIDGETVEDWQGLHWLVLRQGIKEGLLQVETRDQAGHLQYRRLDLSGHDLADADQDPLARVGLHRYRPTLPAHIGQVLPGSRAEAAGLRAGDVILAVDGRPVADWEAVVRTVRGSPERPLRLSVQRDGRDLEIRVTPEAARDGDAGIGRIGASPKVDDPAVQASLRALHAEVRFGPLEALQRAAYKTWDLSVFSLEMLGRLVIGEASLNNLSGPLTIADYAGRTAEAGIVPFLAFLALISVSLGVLNLLPIPLLDGGHLLYYSAEFLTGRPVPDRVQELGQKIGAVLLATLMFFALFNDFHRLLAG